MTKEALELALEAFEGFISYLPLKDEAQCNRYEKAITAIKEALAQEQEPVAWITPDGEGFRIRFSPPVNDVPLGWDALYTTPPKRKPLTGERLSFEAYTIDPGGWNDLRLKFAWHKGFHEGARAIEAAHNIKE